MTRLLDVAAAAVLTAFFLPVIALFSLALALCCGGRVFSRRRSCGKAPAALCFSTDVQADAVGSGSVACALCGFLDRSRLATLPQLVSVLQGDMTLFGPWDRRPVLLGGPDPAAA